jgi:hypothetical protein
MAHVVNLVDECTKIVRKELKQNLQTIKNDAIAEAHTYTNLVTEELRDQLDVKFEEMMGFLSSTKKLLQNGISPRNAQQKN